MQSASALFACPNAGCPGRSDGGATLVKAERAGWLRCPACGFTDTPGGLVRPYARQTSLWIVGSATAFVVGWRTPEWGTPRWLLFAAAATELAIVVYRIVRQKRMLRAMEQSLS